MRQLGINRRFRQPPVFADILRVRDVQEAVFQAHAAYEKSESINESGYYSNATSSSGSKWKQIKRVTLEALAESGQRKRTLHRFERLSEFDLQCLVFAQDVNGPYFR